MKDKHIETTAIRAQTERKKELVQRIGFYRKGKEIWDLFLTLPKINFK